MKLSKLFQWKIWMSAQLREVKQAPQFRLLYWIQTGQTGQPLLGQVMLSPKQVPANGHPSSCLHLVRLLADLGRGVGSSCPGGGEDRARMLQVKRRKKKKKSWLD